MKKRTEVGGIFCYGYITGLKGINVVSYSVLYSTWQAEGFSSAYHPPSLTLQLIHARGGFTVGC